MNYIFDTCVISEVIRQKPSGNVLQWIDQVPDNNIYLSVITIGELQKGITLLGKSKRAQQLQHWLNSDVATQFKGRILPVDERVATIWGQITAAAQISGDPKPAIDALIAATALANSMTPVTRNISDMDFPTLTIIDLWTI